MTGAMSAAESPQHRKAETRRGAGNPPNGALPHPPPVTILGGSDTGRAGTILAVGGSIERWTTPEEAAAEEARAGNAGVGEDDGASNDGMQTGRKGGAQRKNLGRIHKSRMAGTGGEGGIHITALLLSPYSHQPWGEPTSTRPA